MSIFTDRLEELMKTKSIKFNQLSESIGIGKNSFTYWKKNNNIPKGDILNKISEYFNVSVDYLLGISEIKTAPSDEQKEQLNELVKLSADLTDDEIEKVKDYVSLLKNARKQ